MKFKRIWVACILLLVVCGIAWAAYQQHQQKSPAYTLQVAGQAITERDEKKFNTFVDANTFIASGYDDGAVLLTEHIGDLHQRYPDDPFFQHDEAFMKSYTAAKRSQSLAFIHQVLSDYFQGPDRTAVFDENTAHRAQWLAGQLLEFQKAGKLTITKITEQDNKAYATLHIDGDASPYGKLLAQTDIVLELDKQHDGTWKIMRLANAKDLLYPLTDKTEAFWTLQGWQ